MVTVSDRIVVHLSLRLCRSVPRVGLAKLLCADTGADAEWLLDKIDQFFCDVQDEKGSWIRFAFWRRRSTVGPPTVGAS